MKIDLFVMKEQIEEQFILIKIISLKIVYIHFMQMDHENNVQTSIEEFELILN